MLNILKEYLSYSGYQLISADPVREEWLRGTVKVRVPIEDNTLRIKYYSKQGDLINYIDFTNYLMQIEKVIHMLEFDPIK